MYKRIQVDSLRCLTTCCTLKLCVGNSSVLKIYIIRRKLGPVAKNATSRPSAGNQTRVLWITSSLHLLSSTDNKCKCQILLLIYVRILYVSVYTHANISNCNANKISVAPERLSGRFMLSINTKLYSTWLNELYTPDQGNVLMEILGFSWRYVTYHHKPRQMRYIPYLAYSDWDSFGPSNTLLKLRKQQCLVNLKAKSRLDGIK